LEPVTLPGIGETYLDDTITPTVQDFIEGAAERGVQINVNSAFRTLEHQNRLRNDPDAITPAVNSLHSCGFAIDINYSSLRDIEGGLTGDEQREIIREAAEEAGLDWGGDFRTPDRPHFYVQPEGDRADLIREAQERYNELNSDE
jgi:hypothetical protein